MPKVSDYSKSLIYKIEHLDKPELCYVGSTVNFVKRKYEHKSNCINENCNFKIYRLMRENGGWEAFKMVIIKEYPCKTKIELKIEEEKYRKELQANLNSHRCHITKEEHNEYFKKYAEEHKEHLNEYFKKYTEQHKEHLNEYFKKYAEEHKEHIQEKNKEKMTCVCGSTFRRYSQSRHEKSTKHCEYISNN